MIGIAGLARSGKDTVASLLLKHSSVATYALADPLKMGCQVLFGLSDAQAWNDDCKEKKIALWRRSPREFFQRVGTDWMRTANADHWLMRAQRAINPPLRRSQAEITPRLQDRDAPFKLAAQAFFDFSSAQLWDDASYDTPDPFWHLSPRAAVEWLEKLTLADFPNYSATRVQRTVVFPSRQLPVFDDKQVIVIKDIRFENEASFIRCHHGRIWHVARKIIEKVNPHSSEHGIRVDQADIVIDNNGSLEQLARQVENAWQQRIS